MERGRTASTSEKAPFLAGPARPKRNGLGSHFPLEAALEEQQQQQQRGRPFSPSLEAAWRLFWTFWRMDGEVE